MKQRIINSTTTVYNNHNKSYVGFFFLDEITRTKVTIQMIDLNETDSTTED